MVSGKNNNEMNVRNVVIIGSGPAGYTAAVYLGRANIKPLLYEGDGTNDMIPGGQLTTTTIIENYPGFEKGILGSELMDQMKKQALNFNVDVVSDNVVELDVSEKPFKITTDNNDVVFANAVIIASGSRPNKLEDIVEEGGDGSGFFANGISTCAVCDGSLPAFRNKPLAVIGGGDSAMEEAIYLTKFASKVYIILRRDIIRASVYMQNKAKANEKIEFIYSHKVRIAGGSEALEYIIIEDLKTNIRKKLEISGMFYAIGHTPNTSFIKGINNSDFFDKNNKCISTEPGSSKTKVEGIFAAGDVQDSKWRQAIVAAGTGCIAALEAEHYISNIEFNKKSTKNMCRGTF